jgi:hypothetical protein
MLNKPLIQTAVDTKISNEIKLNVIGEWTVSRYTTLKDNSPYTNQTSAQNKEGRDLGYIDLFPKDSVTKPFRDPGIVYSTLYDSYSASYTAPNVISDDRNNNVRSIRLMNWEWPESKRTDNRLYPRAYVAGRNTKFKYWISSAKTLSTTDGNGRTAGQFSCTLADSSRALSFSMEFEDELDTNKIVAKMNTHIGNPQGLEFWVKKDGVWTQVASGINCPNNGVVEIYRPYSVSDTPGAWTTNPVHYTVDQPNSIKIQGIRIKVNSMLRTLPSGSTEQARNASFELVEFTPRLSVDLTDRLESWDVSIELGNNDAGEQLIGNVSTNVGSITLANDDGFLDSFGSNTVLKGKLDEFVEFTLKVDYPDAGGTPSQRTAQLLNMVSDTWSGEGEDTVTASLMDHSKVLQEADAQETLVKNIPAYAAIWLLCDGVGFNRVDVYRADSQEEDDLNLEYFWTDGERSVWEYIQEIAKSFQMAVFFDNTGRLQVMTRKYLFDRDYANTSGAPMDYYLRGESTGNLLPNIVSVNKTESTRFNKVTVKYSAINEYNSNKSRNSIVWKAPDPLVLGAADIVQSAAQGSTQIKIDPRYDDALFGYKGKFSIEDRDAIIEYEAKKYQLRDGSTRWIHNETEMSRAREANDGPRPTFTGWVKLVNELGRDINAVVYDLRQNWRCMKFDFEGTNGTNNWSPVKFVKNDKIGGKGGSLSFTTNMTGGGRFKMWKEGATYDKYDRVGIKFKIVSGDPTVGVVVFPQSGSNYAGGYHVMALPEKSAGDGDKVRVVRVKDDGKEVRLPWDAGDVEYADGVLGIGTKKEKWQYLEAVVFGEPGNWKISVYIDGNYIATFTDNTAGALPRGYRAQFMVAGAGRVLIDRFYVANTRGKKSDRELTFHRIGRKDLLYNRKASPSDKQFNEYKSDYLKKKYNARFWSYEFNSAGWATAREVAQFKADFEKPAIKQTLYLSNKNAHVNSYKRGPMGSRFTLENTSERNQLLQGSKETKYTSASKDQSTFIYAKTFSIQEEQKIVYKDEEQINMMGENAIELTGQWLQTRSSANDVAKYIRDRMVLPSRRYSVEIYGNPLIEVGDIVGVVWSGRTMAENTYVVSSVSHSWSDGLETTVGLVIRQDAPPKKVKVWQPNVETNEITPPGFYQISASTVD